MAENTQNLLRRRFLSLRCCLSLLTMCVIFYLFLAILFVFKQEKITNYIHYSYLRGLTDGFSFRLDPPNTFTGKSFKTLEKEVYKYYNDISNTFTENDYSTDLNTVELNLEDLEKEYDVLIIGAGFSGAVLADLHARVLKKKVLVIEKRRHIGGNSYDYVNDLGIRIHKYGIHLFHTKVQRVWDYISSFVEWIPYEFRPMASVDGKKVSIPVGIDTVNRLHDLEIETSEEMKEFLKTVQIVPAGGVPKNGEEAAKANVGELLYEKIYKGYTKKQWDKYPEDLEASILERVGVRENYDVRYFTDQHQFLPKKGYTSIFEAMFSHPNIDVHLNIDYFENLDSLAKLKFEKVFYSGPIDRYFDYEYGKLEWRSLNFMPLNLNVPFFQLRPMINYPTMELMNRVTRIIEYKLLPNQPEHVESEKTTVIGEFSSDYGEEYYPVLLGSRSASNVQKFEKYKKLASGLKDVHFVGRLANYKYFNMDQTINNAMNMFEEVYQLKLDDFVGDIKKKEGVVTEKKKRVTIVSSDCRGEGDMNEWTNYLEVFNKYEQFELKFHIVGKCKNQNAIEDYFNRKKFKNFEYVDEKERGTAFSYLSYLIRYQGCHQEDEIVLFFSDHKEHSNGFDFVKNIKRIINYVFDHMEETNDYSMDLRERENDFIATTCPTDFDSMITANDINLLTINRAIEEFKRGLNLTSPYSIENLDELIGHKEFMVTNDILNFAILRNPDFIEDMLEGILNGKNEELPSIAFFLFSSMFRGTTNINDVLENQKFGHQILQALLWYESQSQGEDPKIPDVLEEFPQRKCWKIIQ